jgi:4-hydroxy-3-polyprenylbenzoate decarboxylase
VGYRSLRECIDDLERTGQVRRVREEVDPNLEAAEVQRRVFRAGGPAVYYERVKGCAFPMVSNLFGTMARVRHVFRDSLEAVRGLVDAKVDPAEVAKSAGRALRLPGVALHLVPRPAGDGPVFARRVRLGELPRLVSWPGDGGPFVTLPQVYTEDPDRPGVRHSNLGMYRVQLAGNDYAPDREAGLHYQLHRGIGVHHAAAIRRGERLRVNVFVGGPPAMAVAAVMPLPEGLPEVSFAGALNRRAVRMVRAGEGPAVHAEADFCIRGYVNPRETKPEGPFGDHLGYYAKAHPFPVLHVEEVLCRDGAIWPFTTVGRPPQEDTMFGELIHELTGPLVPTVLPGVRAVHAVDAAGVHPLLLAIGSERYVPYAEGRRPMEVLTQANAILGQGQMSLAKYLFIVAGEDAPSLDVRDAGAFLRHALERFDPARDLHFQTNTTIDTLDYSGTALNEGSKVVVAAVGPARRALAREAPPRLPLPDGFGDARLALPGALVVRGPAYADAAAGPRAARALCEALAADAEALAGLPLVVIVDDAEFAARTLDNFLWVTFTRSDPARDVHGVGAFVEHKAWGCRGPVVIDARAKPHHAPPLVEDPAVTRRVDALFARGGSLHGLG